MKNFSQKFEREKIAKNIRCISGYQLNCLKKWNKLRCIVPTWRRIDFTVRVGSRLYLKTQNNYLFNVLQNCSSSCHVIKNFGWGILLVWLFSVNSQNKFFFNNFSMAQISTYLVVLVLKYSEYLKVLKIRKVVFYKELQTVNIASLKEYLNKVSILGVITNYIQYIIIVL